MTETRRVKDRRRHGGRGPRLEAVCLLILMSPMLAAAQAQHMPPQAAPTAPAATPPAAAAAPSVQDLNAMLTQARADVQAGNPTDAITLMNKATSDRPDIALLWYEDGVAEMAMADNLRKSMAAKNQIYQLSPEISMGYYLAAGDFEKATKLQATPAVLSAAYEGEAEAEGREGLLPQAHNDFAKAVQLNPANAAVYTANEAIITYDDFIAGKSQFASTAEKNMDPALLVEAADRAIALNPNNATLYYIKASGLSPTVTSLTSPNHAALVEACNRYLQLAPTGPYAADARKMLAGNASGPPNRR